MNQLVTLPHGLKVEVHSASTAFQLIIDNVRQKKSGFSLALNTEKILRLNDYPQFKEVFDAATVRICDGVGLNLFTKSNMKKINLPIEVIKICKKYNFKLGIFGTDDHTLNMAITQLKNKYDLEVTCSAHGFHPDQFYLEKIKVFQPDIIFLGMGSPKQEYLSLRIVKETDIFVINVGGAIDVLSGKKPPAPDIIQHSKFEWLFRFLIDPKRLMRIIRLFRIFLVRYQMND